MVDSPRVRLTPQRRQEILDKHKDCYLCKALGLPESDFQGYESSQIQIDHVRPRGRTGGSENDFDPSNYRPLHAHPDGLTPEDEGFETAHLRNCHKGKGAAYRDQNEFVRAVRAKMAMRTIRFIDEIGDNLDRDPSASNYVFEVAWSATEAAFRGRQYPLSVQRRTELDWIGFEVDLPISWIFTDHASQVRPAKQKELKKLVDAFIQDDFPVMNSVHARVDRCGHIVVFDGNHRGCAAGIAYGVAQTIPVKIWKIESSLGCALEGSSEADDFDFDDTEGNVND